MAGVCERHVLEESDHGENYVTLLESGAGWIEPVAQESVVDSALLRSNFRPFKTAFLYTSCTQMAIIRGSRWMFRTCSELLTIRR